MSAENTKEGQGEIAEWNQILDHIEGLYPIFAERGYSRAECLNAWIMREAVRDNEDEGEQP